LQIRVRLDGMGQAERLRTALYRFHEARNFAAPPELRIVASEGSALIGVADLGGAEQAEAFRRFWDGFRVEPFAVRGLSDF
jgi:hypothetical protein